MKTSTWGQTRSAQPKETKLLGLEVIRFLSAVSVLIYHYQHFYTTEKPYIFIRDQKPLYSLLWFFYDFGYYGVQIFWCISGFIFFWKYKDSISDGIVTLKKFFVLRFSRLYPLHFVTLILVLYLQSLYFLGANEYFVYQNNDIAHFALQLFLASNWGFEKGGSFNGPIWSISVEVLVYCVFFLVLRYIGNSFLVNIGVLLLCIIAKFYKFTVPAVDCLALFYVGGLSAIAFKYFENHRYRKYTEWFSFFVLLITPLAVYISRIYEHRYFDFIFLITYVPTLLFLSVRTVNAPPILKTITEAAGNMTYSSYLIHFPAQLLIVIFFQHTGQAVPYSSTSFFAIFISITLFASYLIYRFFELPARNYIRNNIGTQSKIKAT